MSKPSQKPTTAPEPPTPGPKPPEKAQAHHPAHKGILDEDTVHVPRGMSRWQFILLIALTILLLLTFFISDALYGIFRGGERNPVFARWERPGHGTVEWHGNDVQGARDMFDTAFKADPFLAFVLGIDSSKIEPRDVVRLMILDQLAEDSGLRISNTDLAEHLRGALEFQRMTVDDFKIIVSRLGVDQVSLENGIRRVLGVSRFLQLAGFAGIVPDPKKIEEQWHEDHAEFAFDYTELPVANLVEEARLSLPDDAGLKAWFDALPDEEKESLKTDEKRKAELVLFRSIAATPATELLAAFPEKPAEGAEPTSPEDLAQQYYNRVFHRRFVKPAAERTGAEGEETPEAETPSEFLSFEEAHEAALAEAPVYFALQRWLDDLKARKTNGETIDLPAEAEKYGLEHRGIPDALSREEFTALEDIGDLELTDAVFAAPADGSFYWSLIPLEQGLAVLRVNERTEPQLPPFEEIREKAVAKWLEPKSQELTLARLETLWKGFETFEPPKSEDAPDNQVQLPETTEHHRADADAFRAAVEGAGLQLGSRSWLDRAGPASKDPQWQEPSHSFLFSQANALRLYDLEADEVAKPGLARDNQHAYLVRLAGKREVPIANMSPSDYDRFKQMTRSRGMGELVQSVDIAFLERNFGLVLPLEEKKTEQASSAPKPASGQ